MDEALVQRIQLFLMGVMFPTNSIFYQLRKASSTFAAQCPPLYLCKNLRQIFIVV